MSNVNESVYFDSFQLQAFVEGNLLDFLCFGVAHEHG